MPDQEEQPIIYPVIELSPEQSQGVRERLALYFKYLECEAGGGYEVDKSEIYSMIVEDLLEGKLDKIMTGHEPVPVCKRCSKQYHSPGQYYYDPHKISDYERSYYDRKTKP